MKVGQEVKVRGLDMHCRPTIEVARIVEVLEEGHDKRARYDCVLLGRDGVKVYSNSEGHI